MEQEVPPQLRSPLSPSLTTSSDRLQTFSRPKTTSLKVCLPLGIYCFRLFREEDGSRARLQSCGPDLSWAQVSNAQSTRLNWPPTRAPVQPCGRQRINIENIKKEKILKVKGEGKKRCDRSHRNLTIKPRLKDTRCCVVCWMCFNEIHYKCAVLLVHYCVSPEPPYLSILLWITLVPKILLWLRLIFGILSRLNETRCKEPR